MSLTQALATAISGLRTNQAGLGLVAANVANADTPGYVRKSVNQVATAGNGTGIGVRVTAVQRELDQYVQRQLRVENAGASYASLRAQFYERLQDVYGVPGSSNAFETIYNNFTESIQALSTSPEDPAARSAVVSAAQLLVQRLNQGSQAITSLRSDAELGIADSVTRANEAMRQIASLNQQIAASGTPDSQLASLLDRRDSYVDELSRILDINIIQTDNNQVSIFTNSGVQLVGTKPSVLGFDPQGTMTALSQWSADPSQRTVGTLTLTSPTGGSIDLIQSNAIRSGELAAYLQMRDQDLVQAQAQLDAVGHALAASLSNKTVDSSAVTSGLQTGFDIDIAGLQNGNTITVQYTDSLTNTPRTLTLMRVDDPSVLPLSDSVTASPNDRVIGIDFTGGPAAAIARIANALSPLGLQASNPAGTTLRVLDDGAGNIVDVNAVSATVTETSLAGGSAALPFFTDGGMPYTGAISPLGSQSLGFAGRISVNGLLAGDPSRLVLFDAGVASGDSTRPDFLYQQLTASSVTFPAGTGIGSAATPFTGSISSFVRQFVSLQGEAASTAQRLDEGQAVVLNALQQRFESGSSVNIDEELANLLSLQNAYAANARVLSAVKELFDTLSRI